MKIEKKNILSRNFFTRDARVVARELLGCLLYVDGLTGKIVETEAYMENDPASHTFKGKTKRNEAMFLSGGHSYVYLIYGMHRCFNIVTGKEGEGAAVLIRALEPLTGIELMWERRYKKPFPDNDTGNQKINKKINGLCSGPGKLCQAFDITVENHNKIDITDPQNTTVKNFFILKNTRPESDRIAISERIGLREEKGGRKLWRWFIKDNPFVSVKSTLQK
jgi:DNA-3-methyladenine glycosylase